MYVKPCKTEWDPIVLRYFLHVPYVLVHILALKDLMMVQ